MDHSSSLLPTDINLSIDDLSYQYYDDDDDYSNIEAPDRCVNYLNYTKHRSDYQ